MSQSAAPTQLRTPPVRLVLPPLHPGQRLVADSAARYRVVCCGRQWGKTSLGAALAIAEAAQGGQVWWVSPTFDAGTQVWRIVAPMVAAVPGIKLENRPVYRITFPSGGSVQFRSADNPDSLRGATLDALIVDEAAHMREEAWQVAEPTLMIRKGWALFLSTPDGANWFKDLWDHARVTGPEWEAWRFPSIDSPLVDAEYLEAKRATTSSVWFAQEYLAEFISGASGIFKAADFRYWHPRRNDEGHVTHYMLGEQQAVPVEECRRFASVDLAYSTEERADYTVISSWAVTPKRHLLLLDVLRGHYEGGQIVAMLRSAYDRHNLGYLAIERFQRQLNIIQEAVRLGLPVRQVKADKDKLARALPTAARLEQNTIWFPKGEPWMRELELEVLAFPGGRHDDFVDTLAYAVLEVAKASAYSDHRLVTV